MRKILPVALELVCGLPLVAVGLGGGFVLLQNRTLVYLLFPSLCLISASLGFWRGRRSQLRSWQVIGLLNLPLLLVVGWFLTERAWALLALPLLATIFSALGLAAARKRALSTGEKWLLILLPALLVNLVLAFRIQWYVGSLITSRNVREPARFFELALLEGSPVSSQHLRGRVVVLDFWATWCGPCRREFPELDQVCDRFAGRPDVVFYAVNGARGDTPEEALRYFREMHYRPTVVFDKGHALQTTLSVHGFPTLLILDRAGQIRFRHVGFLGSEDFVGKVSRVIEQLLAEKST